MAVSKLKWEQNNPVLEMGSPEMRFSFCSKHGY